jgi:DNA-directed RNA polymerase specialized sigma24 family protein
LDFDPKSENQLGSLNDDELIDHICAARDAGNQAQMQLALGVFAYRRYDQIVNRIRLKVDSDHDVEDLAMQVIAGVLAARFDGHHAGEAANLISTVIKRRIADFYESRNKATLETLPGADEDDFRPELVDPDQDFTGYVETAAIVSETIDGLSDAHSLVVRLSMKEFPAEEVAEQVNLTLSPEPPMTAPNVHQIMKRFRDKVSGVLEESER